MYLFLWLCGINGEISSVCLVRAKRQKSNMVWDPSHIPRAETFAQKSRRETAVKEGSMSKHEQGAGYAKDSL